MTEKQLLQQLKDTLAAHADAEKAKPMAAYMKNRFIFFGIKQPDRKLLTKPVLKQLSQLPPQRHAAVAKHLWQQPERELHYCCIEFLEMCRKNWQEDIIETFEWMIQQNSWWDSVDTIASHLVGEYFKKFPKQIETIVLRWSNHENMWLNRTAILFQLSYKSATDEPLLFQVIKQHSQSGEFFIQKAIGWALRQYAYTQPEAVKQFVATNVLKPLSKREALKHFQSS